VGIWRNLVPGKGITYNTPGTYTVTLTVGDNGSPTSVSSKAIRKFTVTSAPQSNVPPVASFTIIQDQTIAPSYVTFDASASSDSDGIAYYEWTVSGPSGASNTEVGVWRNLVPKMAHTYTTPGTYLVYLRVSDNGSPKYEVTTFRQFTVTLSSSQNVPAGQGLVANFVATPTSGTASTSAPLTVHFTDTSTGNPVSWDWYVDYQNQPDTIYSHSKNFVQTYYSPGTYSVKLRIKNQMDQEATEIKYNYITVTKPGGPDQSSPLNNQVTNVPPTPTRRSSASVIPVLGALGISVAMIAIRWRKHKAGKV
jgi:PKD repeat protein